MANALEKIVNAVTGRFTLAEINNFPVDVYEKQLSVYRECDRWIKGKALEDQRPTAPGKGVEKYPIRINPLLSTVLKHAYTLFGEVNNDGRPLVFPKLVPEDDSDAEKEIGLYAEKALSHVWWENNGRSIMFENGILSQIYGGCVFKASYTPWEWDKFGGWRRVPIRIERVNPKAFVARPSAGDMFRLNEAWVLSDISLDEARKWGYQGQEEDVTFVEYWSKTEHRTWINKEEVQFPIAIPDGEENPFNGKNPFGFVPLVYIPHVRMGGFYGINAFDHLKGIVKELNLRFADYGDAVNEDSHSSLAMVNVNGSPTVKKIADGLTVVDLGSSANITGSEGQPNLFEVGGGKASTAMKDLVDELVDQYRRDSFVPAVAEGEDEGSQRSALTLATRFWPLTSHVGIERIYFSSGLDVFNTYILKMMEHLDGGGMKIEKKHTTMRMKQSWAPMLPRDRASEVQEWSLRAQNNLGSVDHLLELTRDVDDIPSEREAILEWLKDVSMIQVEAQNSMISANPSVNNQSVDPANKKPGRLPTKAPKTTDQKVGGGGGGEA